jgi:hypothetical protein
LAITRGRALVAQPDQRPLPFPQKTVVRVQPRPQLRPAPNGPKIRPKTAHADAYGLDAPVWILPNGDDKPISHIAPDAKTTPPLPRVTLREKP